MRSLGLPNKTSFCEVNALKKKNTVEHDVNSVSEGFRNYNSTLSENLVKILPKPTNKHSINNIIKYYEHMILAGYFYLAYVSENLILTVLKPTQISKAAGIGNLSGRILKNGRLYTSLLMIYVISHLPLKTFLTFSG